jgi:hypothetical protein
VRAVAECALTRRTSIRAALAPRRRRNRQVPPCSVPLPNCLVGREPWGFWGRGRSARGALGAGRALFGAGAKTTSSFDAEFEMARMRAAGVRRARESHASLQAIRLGGQIHMIGYVGGKHTDFLVERDGFEPEISLAVLPRTRSKCGESSSSPRTTPAASASLSR